MNLSPYVESVQAGVAQAAALADEQTQDVVRRLGQALDSSTRLALIQALSDAAAGLSADLAPASVDLRMSGSEPEFVVLMPTSASEPTLLMPSRSEPAEPGTAAAAGSETDEPERGEEETARISLRLPASVKTKVDAMADREGISTNAWLQRAILDALADRAEGGPHRSPGGPPPPFRVSDLIPFGPHGVFGPNGPFGPHGLFARGGAEAWPEAPDEAAPAGPHHGNHVQGWVR